MAETLLLSSVSCSSCGSGIRGTRRKRLRAFISISGNTYSPTSTTSIRTSAAASLDSNFALHRHLTSLTPSYLHHVHRRPCPRPRALDSSDDLPHSQVAVPSLTHFLLSSTVFVFEFKSKTYLVSISVGFDRDCPRTWKNGTQWRQNFLHQQISHFCYFSCLRSSSMPKTSFLGISLHFLLFHGW